MQNTTEQKTSGRQDQARAGLQWLGTKVREIKFGTLRGLLVRDGAIIKGPGYRARRTGKPRCRDGPEKLADASVLAQALREIAEETRPLKGDWALEVKVAHGTILNWDLEEPEHSTTQATN